MSETSKTSSEGSRKPVQTSAEASARSIREAAAQSSQTAQQAMDKARVVGQAMTETAVETAEDATDTSAKITGQGRDVMMMGKRTAAGVGGRVADISYGRSHHFLSSATQVMDIYRDASERSAERMQALMSSALIFGRGWQRMQHAWLQMLDHSLESAAHKPQDLLRCKNMVELAEVQRGLYLDAVNHAFESSSRLLDLVGRAAQEAVQPLQGVKH